MNETFIEEFENAKPAITWSGDYEITTRGIIEAIIVILLGVAFIASSIWCFVDFFC